MEAIYFRYQIYEWVDSPPRNLETENSRKNVTYIQISRDEKINKMNKELKCSINFVANAQKP